ncbi:hypothetical protein GGQ84_000955 [Desulfitispora alkaliphila]|uniref:hypothetical protein n=1 Tax=Desulfitispora alkaliphila TaxID=622674 RepID=UPI003D25FF21
MLSPADKEFIYANAYIPEHLPHYLVPFSDMEPGLEGQYLYYYTDDVVNFIGYPLQGKHEEGDFQKALARVTRQHSPKELKVISDRAHHIPGYNIALQQDEDRYSILDINSIVIKSKLRNMLNRASRELQVHATRDYTMEHHNVLIEFLNHKSFHRDTTNFFNRIPDYISYSEKPLILEARFGNSKLQGYTIVDFSQGNQCFYLFNFTGDKSSYVPGAADLLLYHLIEAAKNKGINTVNLGLSINTGIERFKRKWGQGKDLPFFFCQYQREQSGFQGVFKGMFKR